MQNVEVGTWILAPMILAPILRTVGLDGNDIAPLDLGPNLLPQFGTFHVAPAVFVPGLRVFE